jgi:hypothetical protein
VYIQKDIQEQTAKQLMLNNVQLMEEILSRSKKKISTDKRIELLGISNEDIEEMSEEDMQRIQFSSTLNNQTSRTGGDTSGADVNIAQRKREEQGSTMASSGKPTGYGKEKEWHEQELERIKEIAYRDNF